MTLIRARIADHPEMTGVSSVVVFGHRLTRDFSEIEVSEEVMRKLVGNATIEVMVKKPPVEAAKVEPPAKPAEAPKPAAVPAAPQPAPSPQG